MKGGENMAVVLNMLPVVEPKQTIAIQSPSSKDSGKNRSTESSFAKTLSSETDKSEMDTDAKLKNDDTAQLMASMAAMAGVVPPVVERLAEIPVDSLEQTVGSIQGQSADAVPVVPKLELTTVVPIASQAELAIAIPAMPQTKSADIVPAPLQTELTSAVTVPVQTDSNIAVPVSLQTELGNAVSSPVQIQQKNVIIDTSGLLSQQTAENSQGDANQLSELQKLQVQTQLQNKITLEQVETVKMAETNTEKLTNNPVASTVAPSLVAMNNTNILVKNTNQQFVNEKIISTQTTDNATEVISNLGTAQITNTKTVVAPPMAADVADGLLSEDLESADGTLSNQIMKNSDTFATVLQQQSVNLAGQTGVEGKETKPAQVTDSYNVATQIIDQTRLVAGAKNTQMIIQLKPEHLGELTFKVSVENGVINASFHSNNPEVRTIIEASLYQLKQEMSNQGLKVDNVGVYAGLGEFFSNGQQFGSNQQPNVKNQNKKNDEDFLEAFEATESAGNALDASVSGVDYRA